MPLSFISSKQNSILHTKAQKKMPQKKKHLTHQISSMEENEWRSQLYRIVSFSSGALILNWLYYSRIPYTAESNIVLTLLLLLFAVRMRSKLMCATCLNTTLASIFTHLSMFMLLLVRLMLPMQYLLLSLHYFLKYSAFVFATITENGNVVINGLHLDYCRLFIYGANWISLLSYVCIILLSRSCAHFDSIIATISIFVF